MNGFDYYSINNSSYTKKTLTKGTLTNYKSALTRLKNYIYYRKLKKFSFDNCNREFYNDYVSFFTHCQTFLLHKCVQVSNANSRYYGYKWSQMRACFLTILIAFKFSFFKFYN